MDPVSHLALGRALAVLGERHEVLDGVVVRPRDRAAMVAFLLGSLAPDLDALLMPAGWDRYLVAHEYLTHSLAGTLACGALTALVMAMASRSRAGIGRLVLSAWAGAAVGHVTLDVLSGGTVQPLWPVSSARWTLPLVAMADPLLAVPLWIFFAVSFAWRRHAAALARMTIAVSLLVLAVKGASLWRATTLITGHGTAVGPATIEAVWGSFVRWSAFDRRGDEVHAWDVNAWDGSVSRNRVRSGPRWSPEAQASRALDTVRNFEAIYDLGFPRITRDGPRTTVLWSDVRICGRDVCALWFGGTFDAHMLPVEQIVIVGDLRQTRDP